MVDALDGLLVVARFGPEDILHERLRIAVVEGEPARLHLHHHPVPGQKDVVRRRQDASGWPSTSHRTQPAPCSGPDDGMGRARYGTGRAGSEMYSSKAASPARGGEKLSREPAAR